MTEPVSSLKVAMVGVGYFGAFHLNAWRRIGNVELVAVVESDPEQRRQLKSEFPEIAIYADVSDLLSGHTLDIVDIATPPATHGALVKQLCGVVPALICQKPFCGNLEVAKTVIDHAAKTDTKLVVHENFRFMPWYRKINDVIANGDLGDVRQACFRFRPGDGNGPEAYLARQPYFQKMERFLVHETAIHWIDVFRYLFGEPLHLYADLWRTNPAIAGEDAGVMVFDFDDNVKVTFDGNRTLDHNAINRRLTLGEMTVEGENATLTLDGNGTLSIRRFDQSVIEKIDYEFTDKDFGGDCVYHFQRHVVSHVLHGSVLETEAKDYLANLELEELAYRSNELSRRLDCRSGWRGNR